VIKLLSQTNTILRFKIWATVQFFIESNCDHRSSYRETNW